MRVSAVSSEATLLCAVLSCVQLNTGAHSRSYNAALDILTLCSSRLSLDNCTHKSFEVFGELILTEGSLTDGAVDDIGLIETILDLTGLGILNSLANFGGNCTRLGVRHEASRAEDLTETTNDTHHIGRSDNYVEIHPAVLDLLYCIIICDVIGTCILCFLDLIAFCEYESSYGLTGTVRENNGASDLLISVTGVNAESDVELDSLVELSLSCFANEVASFSYLIELGRIDQFYAFVIFLSVLHIF